MRAHEYFSDEKMIETLFVQARKYKVGMIVATQFLGQMPIRLQDAVLGDTSIKFAGGVLDKHASNLARNMRTDVDTILGVGKGTFVAYIKGLGTTTYRASAERVSAIPEPDEERTKRIRSKMLSQYYLPKDRAAVQDELVDQSTQGVTPALSGVEDKPKTGRYSSLDFIDD